LPGGAIRGKLFLRGCIQSCAVHLRRSGCSAGGLSSGAARAGERTKDMHKVTLFILLIALGVAGPSTLRAQGKDVSGAWELTVETGEGQAHPTVIFKQDGEQLTGTYRGRFGETSLRGTLRGEEIRFEVTLRFRDAEIKVAYSGVVAADGMKGTVQFGDRRSGTWAGVRAKGSP
jgi:hypothetical protein